MNSINNHITEFHEIMFQSYCSRSSIVLGLLYYMGRSDPIYLD